MARHNRVARGVDQRGDAYEVGYQPDWLRLVKVTRALASGRQSTKTLFKNGGRREQAPGTRVRTRVASREQRLEFEVEIHDPHGAVRRITVEAVPPGSDERLVFSIEAQAAPRRR
jgi:hypothetical protein